MAMPIISPANVPPTIKRDETSTNHDEYRGAAADLMAAGLVRAEQFPSQGMAGVSYRGGRIGEGRSVAYMADQIATLVDRLDEGGPR